VCIRSIERLKTSLLVLECPEGPFAKCCILWHYLQTWTSRMSYRLPFLCCIDSMYGSCHHYWCGKAVVAPSKGPFADEFMRNEW
jgi:hypothetical protein